LNQVINATHTFTVTRSYDGLGRQYLTDTNSILVNSTFDAYGRAVTQSTPHSGSETVYYTTTTYDALGRPDLVTAPDGTQTDYLYNGLTTLVSTKVGGVVFNGHTITTVTDIWGRTKLVTPPTGPAVSFDYDALGNMTTATRGGVMTTLTYDNAGRKKTMTDPDMGFWQYEYDALGSMVWQLDARNCTTNLTYDLLGRPLTKTYSNCPSTPSVTYEYDQGTNGIGRKYSVSDASGLTVWSYDIRGRVTSEAKQFSGFGQFVTGYTYNDADMPVTMTYPDGEVVTFTYNNQMLLDSVIGTDTYVFDTQYDSASRMTSRTLGNGLVQNYDFYAWNVQGGRLENLSTESLQNFTYQYDPVGNINSIADSVNSQTQTFTYDALDRLITAGATGATEQGGYATETYGYDSTTGNLSTKAGVTYTYDVNHKHAVSSLSNGNSYVYDANGNMTTRNADGKSYTFAYDAENRLVSVSGDSTATFTFNGDGQRVKSVMDGETVLFVGGHYEITNPGASRVALRKSGTLSYMLADHLGSTSLVTDTNGNRTSELRYKPWGETRFSFGTMPTKYTFTGQFSYTDDPSTPGSEGFGLMYYGARWVDVSLGRFTQPDSIIPDNNYSQSWDRYAYVGNNPVKNTDPDGHCWPLCTMLMGAAIGGAISVISYAVVQTVMQRDITLGGIGGAFVGGAIAGAVAGVAGPIAGSLIASTASVTGITATAASVTVGAAIINAAAGEAAYVASVAVTNAIDVPRGEEPVAITPAGLISAPLLSGSMSVLADVAVPARQLYSVSQAAKFAPSCTWGSQFSGSAYATDMQNLISNGTTTGVFTLYAPLYTPTEEECYVEHHGLCP